MECIIDHHKLEEVMEALTNIGISGLTISEVREYDSHGGHTEYYRGVSYRANLKTEMKVEAFIPEDQVDKVESVVKAVVQTGEDRGGEITIMPVESSLHI
jgi:nitrogen regulatory protein P-II 1